MANEKINTNVIARTKDVVISSKEHKSLTPKLRFKEFDGEWEVKKLGQISTFSKGKNISKADIVEDGDLECIRYGELYTEYNEIISHVISKTNLNADDLVLSEYNDVIIPASGETQIDIATASCVLKDGVALGGDLNIIKSKSNGIFLSYYLNSKRKTDIARLSQGVSVVHLYSTQLKSLDLKLPKDEEQQKIANFLTAVDTKLQQLTKKKALLEAYKKGVMQQLFSQQLRFKADDITKTNVIASEEREKQSVTNETQFPDWEEKRLGEVSVITMGQSPDSKSYNENGEGLFLIQGNADIFDRLTNPRQWTSEPTKECSIGDLVLTVRAPVGSIAKSIHNACIGRGVCSVRNNDKSIMEYLYQFLLSYETKWTSLEQGSTFTAVSGKDIKSVKLNLPSLKEQQKIAHYLSALDAKIELVNTQITITQAFKKGLLQGMFV